VSDGWAVSAKGLGKAYRLYARPADRLLEALTRRRRHETFRALEDVSFELPRGRSLGLVGENGAGKSTLLKLVAGTTTPTEGTVETRGSVASILELGAGFHPEFTGEQNARVNAALLGLSAAEVRSRMPRIREFAELGDFFGRPVKTYSSGMGMRLAFSVATHVDAEVLIVDEALSVGDGYFQKKSIDRILEFKKRGGTLLFCSHAMYYVASICDEAIWLDHGRVRERGPVLPVVRRYEAYLQQREERARPDAAGPASGGRPAMLTDVVVHDGSGFPRGDFGPRDTIAVDAAFRTADPGLRFTVRIGIDREDGVQVFACDTREWPEACLTGRSEYRVRLTLPRFPVSHGDFTVFVYLSDENALHLHDARILSPGFSVSSPHYAVGLLETPRRWSEPRTEPASGALRAAASGDDDPPAES
jgi:lipopolysaccharide transport system ATP-binding protein